MKTNNSKPSTSADILTKYLESAAAVPVAYAGKIASSLPSMTTTPSTPFDQIIGTSKTQDQRAIDYQTMQKMIEQMIAAQAAMHDPEPHMLQPMNVPEMMDFIFGEVVNTGRLLNCKASNLYYIMSEYAKEETVNNDPYLGNPGYGHGLGYYNHQHSISNHSTYRQTYRRLKLINSGYRQHSKKDNIILNHDKTKYMDMNFVTISQFKNQDVQNHRINARINIEFKHFNPNFPATATARSTCITLDYDISMSSNEFNGWANEVIKPHHYKFSIYGEESFTVMFDKKGNAHAAVLSELKEDPMNIEFNYNPMSSTTLSDEDKFQLDLLNYSAILIPVLEVVKNDYGISFY